MKRKQRGKEMNKIGREIGVNQGKGKQSQLANDSYKAIESRLVQVVVLEDRDSRNLPKQPVVVTLVGLATPPSEC